MWSLPGPGIEPVSPALAGRFLTTGLRLRKWSGLVLFNENSCECVFVWSDYNCNVSPELVMLGLGGVVMVTECSSVF